ncbi:MAG: 2Fe-2S iron-sulfur cluster-binding protein [Deltaproteobacteria bacterium]|nr:2Fe-2S iron-sulfur cluster-binding protein [Deltaproteobacteria bacterium]
MAPKQRSESNRRLTGPFVAPRGNEFTFEFEGEPVAAHEGETIAEALLAAGVLRLSRSPKYHRPRGAFCFAGQCATCLVRVNGRPNVRACMEPAFAHTRCERQNAFPDADVDMLRAADWLFPGGMDHHHMMTGTRVGNAMFLKLVRQMGGTGTLPDVPDTRFGPLREAFFDVCIVGAGPAGLTAAAAIAEQAPHASVLVIDQQRVVGGSWLAEPEGKTCVEPQQTLLQRLGVQLWSASTALGHYPEDDAPVPAGVTDAVPGVLAVLRPTHAAVVRARRFVFATGAYEQNLPFASNDAPGVMAARAFGRLVFTQGILPSKKVKLLVDPQRPFEYANRLQMALQALGVAVTRVEASADPTHDVRVDAKTTLAVAALPAPAFELPRQHGLAVTMQPSLGGFAVQANADGTTSARGVFVAGDVTGYMGPKNAETHGRAVGAAVGLSLRAGDER